MSRTPNGLSLPSANAERSRTTSSIVISTVIRVWVIWAWVNCKVTHYKDFTPDSVNNWLISITSTHCAGGSAVPDSALWCFRVTFNAPVALTAKNKSFEVCR